MVRKDEPELLREINAAIVAALQDGTLRRIYSRYRMWNQTQSARGLETNSEGEFTGDLLPDSAVEGAAPAEPVQAYTAVRGWNVIRQRGGLLARSAGMTVLLSVCSMPLAMLAGLALALIRMFGPWFLGKLATLYVEIVRGTPLVLQLYVIFFLLPEIGLSLHAFWAAVLGLAINYSAYEAEIYRAGLQAIPRGQMEAALSLGMTRGLALRRIIVPQATRLVIPPVTNDFIALFKDTAVCSVITVVELSKQYYIQARSTGAIVELGILTGLLYMAMSYPLSIVAGRLERRLSQERTA
jgi:polar amino acid transport system substrate-binding protein